MKLSIITVVMDELEELSKTQKSILSQHSDEIEWVVVHGGKDREIVNFVNTSKSQLDVLILSESDKGIYDAMNKGLVLSSGDYVVFLNAGDVFHDENVVDKVFKKLKQADCEIDMLFGAAELVFENGKKILRKPKNINNYIWHGLPANHQATYYKSSSIVLPAYDLKYKMCGDYYIVSMMYLNGATNIVIDEPLVDFKVGGASYHNPWLLVKEAYMIQRDVLSTSMFKRLMSAGKRIAATIAFIFIQNGFLKKIN